MYNNVENAEIRNQAALELLRFKALREIARDPEHPRYLLGYEDVNEILTVAGMPVIIPSEINKKEVEVIK